MGRLRPGVTGEQTRAELESVFIQSVIEHRALRQAQARAGGGNAIQDLASKDYPRLYLDPGGQGEMDVRQRYSPSLYLLFGVVGLVLLIACANVANLLLAGLSGALGIVFALWIKNGLLMVSEWGGPEMRALEPQLDWRVLGFTMALSLLTGVIFGLAPAWRAARVNLNEDLKQASGTSSGKRGAAGRALIVIEVALTLILTLGASLLLNSFIRLMNVDLGFRADQVLAAIVLPPNSRYPNVKAKLEFYRRVIERVKALPGVESAAASDSLPYSGQNGTDQVRIEGRPPVADIDPSLYAEMGTVTNDFQQTMGIPLVRGRFFNEHDTADAAPVIVISETTAERYWPGEDPIGKRLSFSSNGYRVWHQVVGMVKSTHNLGLDQPQFPHVYLPVEQWPLPANFLLVRSSLPSPNLADAVRQAVAAVDKEQPVFLTAPLESWVADSVAKQRFSLLLLSLFGALALVLASVGIYGVVSYAAAQRTREIGIRMALGAQSSDVLRLVIKQGMRPALLGVAIGLLGAVALTRLLKSLLFGVSATDPLTFILVATLLGGVALLACTLPARRAAKVDPLTALRHE